MENGKILERLILKGGAKVIGTPSEIEEFKDKYIGSDEVYGEVGSHSSYVNPGKILEDHSNRCRHRDFAMIGSALVGPSMARLPTVEIGSVEAYAVAERVLHEEIGPIIIVAAKPDSMYDTPTIAKLSEELIKRTKIDIEKLALSVNNYDDILKEPVDKESWRYKSAKDSQISYKSPQIAQKNTYRNKKC
jgi:hypothetical protein